MKFFLDNCVSFRIARALRELADPQRIELAHLTDRFAPDTKDPVWLPALGSEGGWIIVSGDTRIATSKAERAAWHESGLTAFFFDDLSRRSLWVQAGEVIRMWSEIEQQAKRTPTGHGFCIPFKSKTLRQIYP